MNSTVLESHAGRDPYAGERVAIYRNLNKGRGGAVVWSVKALDGPHKGTLVAHARSVALVEATMHINSAAQARIAAGAAREVHAHIAGRLVDGVDLSRPRRLTYHPHARPEFFLAATGEPCWSAAAVVFTDGAYLDV